MCLPPRVERLSIPLLPPIVAPPENRLVERSCPPGVPHMITQPDFLRPLVPNGLVPENLERVFNVDTSRRDVTGGICTYQSCKVQTGRIRECERNGCRRKVHVVCYQALCLRHNISTLPKNMLACNKKCANMIIKQIEVGERETMRF